MVRQSAGGATHQASVEYRRVEPDLIRFLLDAALVAAQANPAIAAGIASAKLPASEMVEIGLANDSSTEIISGLKEGDWVVARAIKSSAGAAPTPASQGGGLRIPGIGGGGNFGGAMGH